MQLHKGWPNHTNTGTSHSTSTLRSHRSPNFSFSAKPNGTTPRCIKTKQKKIRTCHLFRTVACPCGVTPACTSCPVLCARPLRCGSTAERSLVLLVILILAVGTAVTLTLHHLAVQQLDALVDKAVALGHQEGASAVRSTFLEMQQGLQSAATSVALLHEAGAWTRNNSYYLAQHVVRDEVPLLWWEALPTAPGHGLLQQRLAAMAAEYGLSTGPPPLEPRIHVGNQTLLPLSQFYPDNSTQRHCGPFLRSGSTCVINPTASSDTCTLDRDCLLAMVYPGKDVPLNVTGPDVFQYAAIGADTSRCEVSHTMAALLAADEAADEAAGATPAATQPLPLRMEEPPIWGVRLWMPVRSSTAEGLGAVSAYEHSSSSTAGSRTLGYLSTALRAGLLHDVLAANPSLRLQWWVLYDAASGLLLATSQGIDAAYATTFDAVNADAQRNEALVLSHRMASRLSALHRTWVWETAATAAAIEALDTSMPALVLTTGLLGTVLVAAAAAVLLKHMQHRAQSRQEREELQLAAERRVHDAVLGYVHHELRGPLHIVSACIAEALLLIKAMLRQAPGCFAGGSEPPPSPPPSPPSSPPPSPPLARHRHPGPSLAVPAGAATGRCISAESTPLCSVGAAGLAESPTASTPARGTPAPASLRQCRNRTGLGALIQRCQEFLLHGAEASSALSRQLQDLMDLQQLQRGQLAVHIAPVDMVRLLQHLVASLQRLARVPVVLDVSRLQAGRLDTDGMRVRQILVTGLMNAIRHTAEGHIHCTAWLEPRACGAGVAAAVPLQVHTSPRLRLRPDRDPKPRPAAAPSRAGDADCRWLLVAVVDTGLRRSERAEDVTPFAAFDAEQKKLAQLSSDGVGMPLSHLIAIAMGGTVAVTQLDRGCEFRLRLPVTVPQPTATALELATATAEARTTVPPATAEALTAADAGILRKPLQVNMRATARAAAATGVVPPVETVHLAPLPNLVAPTLALGDEGPRHHHALIVDDVSLNVRLAANMLKRLGHTCEVIATGDFQDAIVAQLQRTRQCSRRAESPPVRYDAVAAAPPFSVILLDIRLGTANGVHILKHLRREWQRSPPPRDPPPVIAMTASTTPLDVAVYQRAGFRGLLAKPFSMQKLEQVLQGIERMQEERRQQQADTGRGDGEQDMAWIEVA